jgi:hypothetical protein
MFAALVAAIVLTSASLLAQPGPTLIVSVSADKKPIAGIDVRAGGLRAKTAANGEAAFELPPGTYEIIVTTAKHVPASATVTVAAAAPARVAIELEPLPGRSKRRSS